MSVRVMSWVWSQSASRGVDRLVLLAIADSAEDDGGNAWPSTATLASKAGVDERTVQRSTRRLVESGELEVSPGAGRKGTNVYRVTMTPAESHPRQRVTPDSVSPPAESHPGTESPTPRQSATPGGGTAPPEPSLTRPEPSVARPAGHATRPANKRAPDPLWDSLMAVCGIDTSAITSSARGAYNRARKDLAAVGADPEQVRRRAAEFRRRWPDVTLTPTALAKQWAACVPRAGGQQRASFWGEAS